MNAHGTNWFWLRWHKCWNSNLWKGTRCATAGTEWADQSDRMCRDGSRGPESNSLPSQVSPGLIQYMLTTCIKVLISCESSFLRRRVWSDWSDLRRSGQFSCENSGNRYLLAGYESGQPPRASGPALRHRPALRFLPVDVGVRRVVQRAGEALSGPRSCPSRHRSARAAPG